MPEPSFESLKSDSDQEKSVEKDEKREMVPELDIQEKSETNEEITYATQYAKEKREIPAVRMYDWLTREEIIPSKKELDGFTFVSISAGLGQIEESIARDMDQHLRKSEIDFSHKPKIISTDIASVEGHPPFPREVADHYETVDFDFAVADAYHLPFEDTSVDVLLNLHGGDVFYNLDPEKLGKLIGEYDRVLKTNGKVILDEAMTDFLLRDTLGEKDVFPGYKREEITDGDRKWIVYEKEEKARFFETKEGEMIGLRVVHDTKSIPDEEKENLALEMVAITEEGIKTTDGVVQQMRNGNYELYYAIGNDGRMASYATVFPSDEDFKSCYINKIQVASDKRERGIAGFVLRQVMEDFDKVVLVNIIQDRQVKQRMAQLYKRLGFANGEEDRFVWRRSKRR